jgi:lipopolysaccharide transport system ATP-binding protein
MDEIVAFAELESFIDSPVRTYSSGMQLRLAFSVAVHVRPEVLLVDEVLAVGDLAFQRKCLQRIDLLRSEGAAILFVTHDLVQAQKACSQVAWLDKGHVAAWGPAAEVVEIYRQTMQGRLSSGSADASAQPALAGELLRYNENRFGTLALELSKVQLTDGAGIATQAIETGRPLSVEMQWCAAKPLGDVVFTVAVRAIDGLVLCEAHSTAGKLPSLQGKLALCIDRLDLAAGAYYVDVGAYTSDYEVTYDYHWGAYPLQVQGLGDGRGPMRPPLHWEMTGG